MRLGLPSIPALGFSVERLLTPPSQLPQLFANYKAQSADGLSMAFLVVWFLGDVTNLVGSCWSATAVIDSAGGGAPALPLARSHGVPRRLSYPMRGVLTVSPPGALFTHLAPTAIALAGYFVIADTVLIAQCLYYNIINARRAARAEQARLGELDESDEQSPLLSRRRSSDVGLPGSHRRHATHEESSADPLRKMLTGEDDTPDSKPWLHNTLSLLAVYVIGFLGWFISYKAGAWDNDQPGVPAIPDETQNVLEIFGLILGYLSAVCYLLYVPRRRSHRARWDGLS